MDDVKREQIQNSKVTENKTGEVISQQNEFKENKKGIGYCCASGCQSKPIVKCTLCSCYLCCECIWLHVHLNSNENLEILD
ncbi:MAG: hypothetical protein L0H53_15725 [Candidatus Nitrosocosmicus sp.]|nr:hypothetical protein [Candidatus Nitrosocosmicus sp.]